jgi:hypothetical protein
MGNIAGSGVGEKLLSVEKCEVAEKKWRKRLQTSNIP